MNITPQQKSKLISIYPELRTWFDIRELKQNSPDAGISLLIAFIQKIDSLKGDTPVKGVDYWTEKELDQVISYILKQSTPIKGIHYDDGKNGEDYVLTLKDKKEISKMIEVPVVEKIIEKTEVKEVMPKSIDVSVVKGAVSHKELKSRVLDGMALIDGRIKLIDQRWGAHGGSSSKSQTWFQDEIVANGLTGTSFNLAHVPQSVLLLYKNGQLLVSGASFDYTRSGNSLTLAVSLLSTDLLTATYS